MPPEPMDAVPDTVTICLTSCGRLDLLRGTLDSFRALHHGGKFIISDDSADPAITAELKGAYPGMTILSGPERGGLMRSIDRLYSVVKTPYLFHMDDDWLFDRRIDWASAIGVLETREDIANVAMRYFSEIKPKYHQRSDPLTVNGASYRVMHRDAHPEFFGWSHSPGLMRTKLYWTYAPFARMRHDQLSALIKREGGREAYFIPGVAHHVGLKRTVTDPTVPARPTSKPAKWLRWAQKRLYYAGLRKEPF
jgi:hypothetical protein